MARDRYQREGLRQLREIYQRLTPDEIARLRDSPETVSDDIKTLQKIAAQRVLRRRGITFPKDATGE